MAIDRAQVLIVDDTPANIFVMKTALESLDVTIITATNGNEALTQLIQHKIAVVLLDVQMPYMDGFEVAELMREHEETRYIPIIFVTAFDQDKNFIFRGYQAGGVDYIFKPFDVNVLKSKVAVFVNIYQQKYELSKQTNELSLLLREKECLIDHIEEQNKRKDLLIEENQQQKKKLDNYFRLKLLSLAGLFILVILIGLVYNTNMARKNSELLLRTDELHQLNDYTVALNEAYQKFIPYDILKLLNKDSILEVKVGDQVLKDMIVLFVDVRGYSTIAENLSSEENMQLINHLLELMQNPILERNGIINKYLGDGLMALFHTNANDALDAAIALLKNIEAYSYQRLGEDKPPIRVGIGIDKGEMMVGTVGTKNRMEQTVVSDAVNVASRIEGMTKMYGASLLISENIYHNLTNPSQYTIRLMDTVKVKGRNKNVIVYQVFDGECQASKELCKKTMKDFGEGLLLFREKKFSEALHAFQKVLEINHDDITAAIFKERCIQCMNGPVENDWSHVRILENK
ncbi:MAG: response regulator [Parachlamydiales bacterium]|jgi:class 3 adenylate cyclase/DNA-binding response OmpR family regulator